MQPTYPSFSTPTRIVSGRGARATLADHVKQLNAGHIILIGDRGLARLGVLEQFEEQLAAHADLDVVATVLADPNPTVSVIEQHVAELADSRPDAIAVIGGGSAMSLAKGVALGLTNPEPLREYGGFARATFAPIPTIAIPTTAGSGGEVSSTFVLYDDHAVGSVAFTGTGYEPNVALLDGELLLGLPDEPMRDAGLDAYSHAFESLWARGATTFSTEAGLAALRIIRATLPLALDSRDPDVLQQLLEAASLANIACGNSGLGLVHALTSASSIHVTHGRQNGIVLPVVGDFNRAHLSDAAKDELDRLDDFYTLVDAPRRFRDHELPADAVQAMVAAAQSHPLRANNIRATTDDDLRRLAELATTTTSAGARA